MIEKFLNINCVILICKLKKLIDIHVDHCLRSALCDILLSINMLNINIIQDEEKLLLLHRLGKISPMIAMHWNSFKGPCTQNLSPIFFQKV